jgi:hypothetical protein
MLEVIIFTACGIVTTYFLKERSCNFNHKKMNDLDLTNFELKIYVKQLEKDFEVQNKTIENQKALLDNLSTQNINLFEECAIYREALAKESELIQQLRDKLQLAQKSYEFLKSQQYIAIYPSNVFSSQNIRLLYERIINVEAVKTNEIHYLAFMNILLYIDSLESMDMYFEECSAFDEQTRISVYQLDLFIYTLCADLTKDRHKFETILAAIFAVLGLSTEIVKIENSKKRDYTLSKVVANKMLHMCYVDDSYIDNIISMIDDLEHERMDSILQHYIVKVADKLESIMIKKHGVANSEPYKIIVFKPKTLSNTLINVRVVNKP